MARRKPTEPTEEVDPKILKPHPRNYRDHPDDQIEHLMHSIVEHGFYRNIVVAKDDTILAGHGVVISVYCLKIQKVPTVRLKIGPNSPAALKILAADNYLAHFAEDDDRILTDLLREIQDVDSLLGTGFDELNLAALVMVTRPTSELADFDAAAEWAGMPEFGGGDPQLSLTLHFENEKDRTALLDRLGLTVVRPHGHHWSARWPPRESRDDLKSLRFEG